MNFLRRTWSRYSKLGKKRKKKQVWRRPTGRDNKMREKRKGYPAIVSIGYKKSKKLEKKIVVIRNLEDLKKSRKSEIIIVGNIGKKKKIEILKYAEKEKISLQNVNTKKFLEKAIKKTEEKTQKNVSKKSTEEEGKK